MPDAVVFCSSESLTLGIEEEFLLVDADAKLAPRANELLDGGWSRVDVPGGCLQPELLRSGIELATSPTASHQQLTADLFKLRRTIINRASSVDLTPMALGVHPHLVVTREMVTPVPALEAIAALHDSTGTLAAQSTCGIHVHIGVPSLEAALVAMDALAAMVPILVACTGNSPIADGAVGPWRSTRSELLRTMPWGGPPPRFTNVIDYRSVHAAHQLESIGPQRFLWEVAPVFSLGTVELRSVDANADPRVALGVAAFAQAVVARALDGACAPRQNESLERHNRWSAMAHGPRARLLVAGAVTPVDLAHVLATELISLRPYARDLGGDSALEIFADLLADPPADHLIAAFESGGVGAAVRAGELSLTPW